MNHHSAPPEAYDENTAASFDRQSGSVVERLLFNNRRWVILLCLALTVFLGMHATRLQLNASYESTVPTQHPYVANYLANKK